MIPQGQYNPTKSNDLLWYLIQELRRCMGDRQFQESQWLLFEEIYRARPVDAYKNFPFDGASNLVIPVAATDVDTLYSRLMGMLFDQGGLWGATASRPELIDFAENVTDFMKWAQDNEIKPYRAIGNWLIELHKLGTGVMKERYVREMKKVYEWREVAQGQTWQQQAIIMLKDHPTLDHVRLHDFFIPAGFPLIQQAPWVAERVRLTWQQFMNRVKAGIYTGADKVGAWFFNPPMNAVQQQLDVISGYRPSINQQMEFYEFWLDFDIDGDGWDEALVCTIHLESQTYVRLDYNPFFNQEKPYTATNFMTDVNSFYGIGLCEMLDNFQEEITAMHNQRIDNGTIINSAMYAVKRDNTNIRQKEPIYPSKIWRVADPSKDIVRLPLGGGGVLQDSIANEAATRSEAKSRTGVNDYVSGNNSPDIGYGAAYTTQQMLANSAKRLGETLRSVNNGLSESGTRLLELYQQFYPNGKPFVALGQRDGQMVDVVLKMPLDLIRKGLKINVQSIDAENSKDAKIRTTTIVFQTLQQYYTNYLQMLSYAANPQMPPVIQHVALQAAEGSSVLMKHLLELYGEEDYDQLLPQLEGGMNEQQRAQANIQAILASAGQGSGQGGPALQPQIGGQGAPGGPQAPAGVLGFPPTGTAGYGTGGVPSAQVGGQPGGGLPFPGGVAGAGQDFRRVG